MNLKISFSNPASIAVTSIPPVVAPDTLSSYKYSEALLVLVLALSLSVTVFFVPCVLAILAHIVYGLHKVNVPIRP